LLSVDQHTNFIYNSFDLQLENWGADYKASRERKITWVFRAWVEDWEKEAIKSNAAVAEVRLLEKY
jgi:hypothetical protein